MSDAALAALSRDMNPDVHIQSFKGVFPALTHLEVADTFWKRAIGLMGRKKLAAGWGFLILRCNSIHTCFMRFPIDAIFLDQDYRVVKVVRGVKPWRMAWGGRQAKSVMEVRSEIY